MPHTRAASVESSLSNTPSIWFSFATAEIIAWYVGQVKRIGEKTVSRLFEATSNAFYGSLSMSF
jgi:hypothetical protein